MGDGLDNETLAVKIRRGDGDRKELLEELWRNNERLVHKIVHGLTGLDSWKAEGREDQGHSPNHVARVMGCSRQNIDQRLKNAYVHLRHGKYGRKLASFL